MSRTFLIEGQSMYSSTTHEQHTAVARAMQDAGYDPTNPNPLTSFHFDLIECVKTIQVKRLRDDVLSRLQFSIDGYINGALSRMLNQLYQHSKTEAAEPVFLNYQNFLRHIEGIKATEESLYEAGCDVEPSIDRLRNLNRIRNELHALAASQLSDPTTYVVPNIQDVIGNPKLRSLSAAAEQGLMSICEDDTDDPELRAELFSQYKLDESLERMNQLRLDQMKAKSLVMLWNCAHVDDDDIDDESDAFFDADARTQHGLLNTAMRAVVDTRRKAVTDNRLPVMEKAALRVEAKALMAAFTDALAHPKFSDVLN